ncbi:hypothetical protein D5R81_06110 [Parashewanella spongiae]|uniref:DNA repair protein n=1 Tax=Parashewanella spongiae TaxID=342950 RepID=A0A3A6TVG7_9GAMM|nr:hypothetical protein [Parashewanella spongiae]MCL1077556.1 hypothetical protein [Parashewanella spongiae]RJY18296.1 hypothetical protein D5R81_06110 [Parashewanella spongiae]
MIFTVVLVVISALLLLIIGINIFQQHKQRIDSERRVQHQRQRAIIDETEAVLDNIALFPCSDDVMIVLYRRLAEAVEIASNVAQQPKQQEYQRRLIDLQNQIQQLLSSNTKAPSIDSIQIPDNDKQLITLVKMLKKLKAILRVEHSKGKVEPSIFTVEENRINNMQLRINVDAMLDRAKVAKNMKQYGSAKQLVHKALSTLNAIKLKHPEDPFITLKHKEAKELVNELDGSQVKNTPAPSVKLNGDTDIDALFQPKKKW